MAKIKDVAEFLEQFAPSNLAETWDNVGLLVGDPGNRVRRMMTCLTVTPVTVAEAVEADVELVVSHHPLPFHSFKRLVPDSTPGRLLWQLATRSIGVYSPHTALDSAQSGINQQLADALELEECEPIVEADQGPIGSGAGRIGRLRDPLPLKDLAARLKRFLGLASLHYVGDLSDTIERVAIGCGAAGQFLEAARLRRCDAFVVGETNFHTCLEAEASGIALLLPGHFASERFAVERLAHLLADRFDEVTVWASRMESDPLRQV